LQPTSRKLATNTFTTSAQLWPPSGLARTCPTTTASAPPCTGFVCRNLIENKGTLRHYEKQ
ncbi:MAG: hypothetical protein ACK518_03505, partial [bacterium]